MSKLAKLEVMFPGTVERRVDDLLIFDSCFADAGTRYELQRLLPQLVHLQRARKVYYEAHGCLFCPKPDPTVSIAARLRRRGSTWKEIYEVTGMTASKKCNGLFENRVRRILARPDRPVRKPSYQYGAGGLCARCYAKLRSELVKIMRKLHEGRNTDDEISALTRRFDVAQWLLGD